MASMSLRPERARTEPAVLKSSPARSLRPGATRGILVDSIKSSPDLSGGLGVSCRGGLETGPSFVSPTVAVPIVTANAVLPGAFLVKACANAPALYRRDV